MLFRWARINSDCLFVLQVCFLAILVSVSSIRTSLTTILRRIYFFVSVHIQILNERFCSFLLQIFVTIFRFCTTHICYQFFVSVRIHILNERFCSFLLQIFVTIFSFLFVSILHIYVTIFFPVSVPIHILNERFCLPILYYKFLFVSVLQVSALPPFFFL